MLHMSMTMCSDPDPLNLSKTAEIDWSSRMDHYTQQAMLECQPCWPMACWVLLHMLVLA